MRRVLVNHPGDLAVFFPTTANHRLGGWRGEGGETIRVGASVNFEFVFPAKARARQHAESRTAGRGEGGRGGGSNNSSGRGAISLPARRIRRASLLASSVARLMTLARARTRDFRPLLTPHPRGMTNRVSAAYASTQFPRRTSPPWRTFRRTGFKGNRWMVRADPSKRKEERGGGGRRGGKKRWNARAHYVLVTRNYTRATSLSSVITLLHSRTLRQSNYSGMKLPRLSLGSSDKVGQSR